MAALELDPGSGWKSREESEEEDAGEQERDGLLGRGGNAAPSNSKAAAARVGSPASAPGPRGCGATLLSPLRVHRASVASHGVGVVLYFEQCAAMITLLLLSGLAYALEWALDLFLQWRAAAAAASSTSAGQLGATLVGDAASAFLARPASANAARLGGACVQAGLLLAAAVRLHVSACELWSRAYAGSVQGRSVLVSSRALRGSMALVPPGREVARVLSQRYGKVDNVLTLFDIGRLVLLRRLRLELRRARDSTERDVYRYRPKRGPLPRLVCCRQCRRLARQAGERAQDKLERSAERLEALIVREEETHQVEAMGCVVVTFCDAADARALLRDTRESARDSFAPFTVESAEPAARMEPGARRDSSGVVAAADSRANELDAEEALAGPAAQAQQQQQQQQQQRRPRRHHSNMWYPGYWRQCCEAGLAMWEGRLGRAVLALAAETFCCCCSRCASTSASGSRAHDRERDDDGDPVVDEDDGERDHAAEWFFSPSMRSRAPFGEDDEPLFVRPPPESDDLDFEALQPGAPLGAPSLCRRLANACARGVAFALGLGAGVALVALDSAEAAAHGGQAQHERTLALASAAAAVAAFGAMLLPLTLALGLQLPLLASWWPQRAFATGSLRHAEQLRSGRALFTAALLGALLPLLFWELAAAPAGAGAGSRTQSSFARAARPELAAMAVVGFALAAALPAALFPAGSLFRQSRGLKTQSPSLALGALTGWAVCSFSAATLVAPFCPAAAPLTAGAMAIRYLREKQIVLAFEQPQAPRLGPEVALEAAGWLPALAAASAVLPTVWTLLARSASMLLPSLPGEAPGAPRPITIREAAAFAVSLASLAVAAWWSRMPGGLFRYPVLPPSVGASSLVAASAAAPVRAARAASPASPTSTGTHSSAAVTSVSITGGAGDFWDMHEGPSASGAGAYRLPSSMDRAAREAPQAVL